MNPSLAFSEFNRSDVIRTRDLCVPNAALYQAEPHSVISFWVKKSYGKGIRTPTNRVRVCCATITPFRIGCLPNKLHYIIIFQKINPYLLIFFRNKYYKSRKKYCKTKHFMIKKWSEMFLIFLLIDFQTERIVKNGKDLCRKNERCIQT